MAPTGSPITHDCTGACQCLWAACRVSWLRQAIGILPNHPQIISLEKNAAISQNPSWVPPPHPPVLPRTIHSNHLQLHFLMQFFLPFNSPTEKLYNHGRTWRTYGLPMVFNSVSVITYRITIPCAWRSSQTFSFPACNFRIPSTMIPLLWLVDTMYHWL